MSNGNLVIVDDEYVSAARRIVTYGNDLKRIIDEYVNIMSYVNTSSISDVEICGAIESLLISTGKFSAVIQDITSDIFNKMNDFIEDVDRTDDFLY